MNMIQVIRSDVGVEAFSLKDAPSLIEVQLPVGRVSAEAYKERKAGSGQTLTALGSYWKGRKPLILVRATVLGCLLPAGPDPIKDLKVFLLLMGMSDDSFARRIKSVRPADIDVDFEEYHSLIDPADGTRTKPRWRDDVDKEDRARLISKFLLTLPYDKRLDYCARPEEIGDGVIAPESWAEINHHLNTTASSMDELVYQLGVMRFGHRPKLADTFAGGGSIPFESARMGCEVFASDLNPVACMLTWAAFNNIGSNPEQRTVLIAEQRRVAREVDREIERIGIERNGKGERAKAYLYCLEVRCPRTGWMVPVAPSWVISKTRNVVARLVPDHAHRRYAIEIATGVDANAMAEAEMGTVRGGRLHHPMNPEQDGVSMGVIRGDYREEGANKNRLRPWGLSDFLPGNDDVFQERLYCIQWYKSDNFTSRGQETYFAAPDASDFKRERQVEEIVSSNLSVWQKEGYIPSNKIEPGDKTDEPIRTRGWTHWHHLFAPRQLLIGYLIRKHSAGSAALMPNVNDALDRNSKLCRWDPRNATSGRDPTCQSTFYNQAFNTLYNYGVRAWKYLEGSAFEELPSAPVVIPAKIEKSAASEFSHDCDIIVTDPPYADAVVYHEITEFFIAWFCNRPPEEFSGWNWNSERGSAIKGVDERFRSDMVSAYRAMANCMPDNGIQVVMFTHQDAGIWADLAAIMWAAGLRVTAAWNIVTETASALKEGNYVQGTILLVLRKRLHAGNIKRMDIEGEIEEAVDEQLITLNALDDDWTSERLYTDGDLQLAAYAAALRVITNYATIDRKEVGADVYRKLAKGEKTVIRELIEYAASVANNKLVPEGFPPAMWKDLDAPSRFYVRMLDMESKGSTKFADYQDFARTFSVADYADLMDSTKANAASLAGSGALKGKMLGGKGFGSSPLRRILFATHKTMQKDDPREGLAFLKTEIGQDYWSSRAKLIALAKYVSSKTAKTRPPESSAADLLAQRLEVDKV